MSITGQGANTHLLPEPLPLQEHPKGRPRSRNHGPTRGGTLDNRHTYADANSLSLIIYARAQDPAASSRIHRKHGHQANA